MELNIWTSSTVTSATKNTSTGKWDVTVKRGDGTERVFHVDHVVFALGLGAGKPNLPSYPGRVSIRVSFVHDRRSLLMRLLQEDFKGQVLHSTEHKSWKDHVGKKVFVVGACVSGTSALYLYICYLHKHDVFSST